MNGLSARGGRASWLVVALLLAACAAPAGPRASPTARPGPAPAASPAVAATATADLPPGFPARFPLPPRRQLSSAGADMMGFWLTLAVPSAEEALAFYRAALPPAGYQAREGSLRPRGAVVPGQTTRLVGGLIFTSGSGDEESEPGGIDALASAQGDTVEILLPRVGRPAAAAPRTPVVPAAAATPRGAVTSRPPSGALSLPAPFPWPPDYREPAFARTGDGVLTVTLTAPSGADTYGFYQGALARAGYQVREVWQPDPESAIFIGRLAFAGHGQAGRLTVNADATAARVTIRFNASPA